MGAAFTREIAMLHRRGWARFGADSAVAAWAAAARAPALRLSETPALQAQWLRCGGTWFAGPNVFPNDADGAAPALGVPPLSGAPVACLRAAFDLGEIAWDRAQISVCRPGYPQPWEEESEAASRFRRNRDAAHVDGLSRVMPGRRRRLTERCAFILGLPLTATAPGASPLVVWEGSHQVMRTAFIGAFEGLAPERWSEIDVTGIYQSARKRCFETLPRVEIAARPGEAYAVHRLALHGVAPWRAGAEGPPRAIAYFRPEAELTPEAWLNAP